MGSPPPGPRRIFLKPTNKEKTLRASGNLPAEKRAGFPCHHLPWGSAEAGPALQKWVAGGNMGQPAFEPHIYLSTSLGPCSLPREAPKSQVGSLLTCLSLSPRRASASSLSSESSESSDAGEAQGCQGALRGRLSLLISLPISLMSFNNPGGLRSLPCPPPAGLTTSRQNRWLGGALCRR